MKVSFQKIKYPSIRHPKMRHKSKVYFPECFVHNAMLCQRSKNLWSLSIWKKLPFLLYILLYTLIGVEKIFVKEQVANIECSSYLSFVSWFIFIKKWKLSWYWEVADSLSLKEILKFTRRYTTPYLTDFFLTWVRSTQHIHFFHPQKLKIINYESDLALSSSTKQQELIEKENHLSSTLRLAFLI